MIVVNVKCPSCGADISVDKDRKFIFCEYCGTKVLVKDENVFTQRHIDDAEVIRAETERMVQMQKIDEQRRIREEEKRKKKIKIISSIVWAVVSAIFLMIGFIWNRDESVAFFVVGSFSLFGLAIFLMITSNNTGANNNEDGEEEIEVTEDIVDWRGKNVDEVVALFESEGFRNIKKSPIYDLTFAKAKKHGKVKSVSINGRNDFDEGDIVSSNSVVIITYHSMPV